MKRLFLFNPENDIALGMGLTRITPPRQAALFHRAGAMIPFWLGEEGDAILVEHADFASACQWVDELNARTGIVGPAPVSDGNNVKDVCLCPWGWSFDTIAQFEKSGVESGMMMDLKGQMEHRRELSHRRSALRFLSRWAVKGWPLRYVLPIEAESVEDVVRFVAENGDAILKSPWSSSGRGIFPVTCSTLKTSVPGIRGIIRHQGSVIVEPLLPKLQDFAMLFNYVSGKAGFMAYSLFFNSTATNYGGNFVASNESILERLMKWVPREKIEAVRDSVMEILPEILGDGYEGPLGVDMMICGKEGETAWIAPCVEVNLRYTMGFVARGIWLKLGREGVMSVSPKGMSTMVFDKNGEEPLRLVPGNRWFDVLFYPCS